MRYISLIPFIMMSPVIVIAMFLGFTFVMLSVGFFSGCEMARESTLNAISRFKK